MRTEQMQMVSVEQIMPENHNYRKLNALVGSPMSSCLFSLASLPLAPASL
jgi:hypothetical protein